MFRAAALPADDLPVPQRRRWRWRLLRWSVIGAIWGALAVALIFLWCARDLPRPEDALDQVRRPSLILRDSGGASLATYGDVVGDPLRLSDMPPFLPQAAVAIEDRRFWTHGGFDPWGMLRAATVDLIAGQVRQGG